MIKFLFCGGKISESPRSEVNKLISQMVENSNFLYIPFALTSDYWQIAYNSDKRFWYRIAGEKMNYFQLGVKGINEFRKQVIDSDVIYFKGGDERLLMSFLVSFKDLKTMFEGKLIIGSSAGVNVFSKYFYSNDRKLIEEGLGLLNIKTICHFDESKNTSFVKLKNFYIKIPTYGLRESEFISLSIN